MNAPRSTPDFLKRAAAGMLLLVGAGCATSLEDVRTGFIGPWSGRAKPDSAETQTAESGSPPASSPSPPSQPSNPFAAEAVRTASVSQTSTSPSSTGGGQATHNSLSNGRFDPATMMLIETEFKDATTEERRLWYEELRQVPPELVPRILRMRRLTQQAVAPTTAATPIPQTRLAGVPQYSPADNPLQALAPWDVNSVAAGGSPSSPSQGSAIPGAVVSAGGWTTPGENPLQPASAAANSSTAGSTVPPGSVEVADGSTAKTWEQALDQLVSLSEQRVASLTPGELEEQKLHYCAQHAYLRMLYLMAGRQERALEAIPQLPGSEQEFWQQMFWAMSSYFDSTGIPNPSDRATHTVSQLAEASHRLRERANLELRQLTFCQQIDGFGIYDRFERDEFRPGQPVLVYAEMRNFLSEPTSDGRYRTILKSTIEIHRAGSQSGLVTRQDFAPTEDLCRNRRQDYFHSYMINIPERVTVGPHILKLIVEDQLNRKVASYTVNFTIQ